MSCILPNNNSEVVHASPEPIGWKIITGSADVETLSEAIELAHLRPRRLEHHLLWLSRTDHGEQSMCGVIAFYKGNVLSNYLPFRVRRLKLRLRLGEVTIAHIPFRALQLYGDGIVGEEAEGTLVLNALAELPFPYDGLTVEEMPTQSTLWVALTSCSRFLIFERSRAKHYVIDLPSNYLEYCQQLSGKTRTNIRRGRRELEARLGSWEVLTFTEPERVHELVRMVGQVATKTFHYHLLGQDLTSANNQFIRNLMTYAQQGWLRAYVLTAGNRPVAYVIGYLLNGCYQYELIGYDPDIGHASPGIVLLAQIVEDLIDGGIAESVDFGAGEALYKRMLGNRSYEDSALLVCRRTLYAISAAVAERLFGYASRLGVGTLEKSGFKRRLKKMLRSTRRRDLC